APGRPLRRHAGRGRLGLRDAGRRRAGGRRVRLPVRHERPVALRGGHPRAPRAVVCAEPMLPYGRQSIDETDVRDAADARSSDWRPAGPQVERFEAAVEARAGVPHAASVTSGTAALHVAYAATGVGPGDEVVTTALTLLATAAADALPGATVAFAD